MAQKVSPEEVEQLHAQTALDRAWAIREEYTALIERRRANRDELRGKLHMDVLTEDQRAQVEELYPARVKSADAEEAPGEASEPVAEAA